MKILFFIGLLMIMINHSQSTEIDVIPRPAEFEFTGGKFILDSTFTVKINGESERIIKASDRFLRRLSGRTGLFFDFDRGTKTGVMVSLVISAKQQTRPAPGINESYNLTVKPDKIEISAGTDIGVLHALETLMQLLRVEDENYCFPAIQIKDYPRFTWRGLMIDASRHFMPVQVIKRNLDGMAAVKLNVFHWHLSDDQGFRVESKKFPNLQLKGSDGLYYTQDQVRDIVMYAAERGIRVVPEFDVPGHATALIMAYPELGSGPPPGSIERKWGIFYQALNPVTEYTYKFLDQLFGEMSLLFPDKYFHIGGDELEHENYHVAMHWNENKDIQNFKKKHGIKDNAALQAYFNSRILKSLSKYGKIMVGWDEILHENMPPNIVIQSWRGRESMERAARRGYQSILSNGYYIDLIYPAVDHYLNDPLPEDTDLTPAQQKLILGGEATMWAEYVSPATIDSRIWPRTAAIAERLWSPAQIKDVSDMYRRLDIISFLLEEHGLTHIKNREMMLRRLTAGRDTEPLKILVDVIEPLKQYRRGSERSYTSYSPLTRVVDVAVPDARAARIFRLLVDAYIKSATNDTNAKVEIITWLRLWSKNHDQLKPIIDKSPILKEMETLSEDLSTIAKTGLQAMEIVEKKRTGDREWLNQSLEILERAGQSRGQTELMIVTAIEKLVQLSSLPD
jgi:hexosaminidase